MLGFVQIGGGEDRPIPTANQTGMSCDEFQMLSIAGLDAAQDGQDRLVR